MNKRIVGNVLRYSYASENSVQPVPSIVDLSIYSVVRTPFPPTAPQPPWQEDDAMAIRFISAGPIAARKYSDNPGK
jgi:hypothetical protein